MYKKLYFMTSSILASQPYKGEGRGEKGRGAKMLQTDRQTDRHTDRGAFAPKNSRACSTC